jgi:hypothetical protein
MSILTGVELVLIAFCVLWNAFFVSAEYAFVSVRHTRLDETGQDWQEPGRPGAGGSHSPPACCFAARSMTGTRQVHGLW